MLSSPSLGVTWSLSSLTGYGLYGLHIVLQFLRRGGARVTATCRPGALVFPPLTQRFLIPLLENALQISARLESHPSERLSLDGPVLCAVGNDAKGFPAQDRVRGRLQVGCAAVEYNAFSANGRAVLRDYDMLIAISRWNEALLRALDIRPVYLCHQGIDTTLFAPGPSSGLFKNRFLIFSGGKLEFRKGQDIVIAAFRRFHEKHPDSLLITCWQTAGIDAPQAFLTTGHVRTLPEATPQYLLLDPWLVAEGLPPGSFINLPQIPNMMMPQVLHECALAIFPNRCEGGTNLVAMEAMACGVPTLVAAHTGQADLVDLLGAAPLPDSARPVTALDTPGLADWRETDPDALVEAMEKVYTAHQDAHAAALAAADRIKAWDWALQNERLLQKVFQES